MAHTVVGLFSTRKVVDEVAHEIEAAGLPKGEIRTISEPLDMPMSNVLSTPGMDFLDSVFCELEDIGAKRNEADLYIQQLRQGKVLLLVTGTSEQIAIVSGIMNHHGAEDVESLNGSEPRIPIHVGRKPFRSEVDSYETGGMQTGGTHVSGGGARIFIW